MAVTTETPDLLDEILTFPKEIRSDLAVLMRALYAQKYTGPVTLHFHLGRPKTAQMLPTQIRLAD